ncbi:hypothetical protein [Alkalibacterium sp. 20]|uniref:hypothetical protein n=1 Tax=Alkalibacterium sp. 20 TaxID=1798803 RepID=UPI0009003819|nr:hypothetical protein AX762_10935 [Alkalibacterium sp. 20]
MTHPRPIKRTKLIDKYKTNSAFNKWFSSIKLDCLPSPIQKKIFSFDKYHKKLSFFQALHLKVYEIIENNLSVDEEGLLVVLSEGSIVENDDSFSLQANVNKDVNFWWGRRRYKSRTNARGWAANIRAAGHLNAAAAFGAAVFGLGVEGAPNTLGAIYAYNLSERIDCHNARTNRGIVADLHFTQTFTIKPQ